MNSPATPALPRYTTFAGCLSSDRLLFPELPPSNAQVPDWSLRVSDEPAGGDVGELLGTWPEPYCNIQLFRMADGFRLRHSCTGEFDIIANGARIVWYPCVGAQLEMARSDVLGRVLSIAFHAAGLVTLHGSAVAFDRGAIAFLAPKGYGKSTLAAALLRAGARLVTDDMVAVELGPPAIARSGVHSMRLCDDSAERLIGGETPKRLGMDGKHVVDHAASGSVVLDREPLSAVYLLKPVTSTSTPNAPAVRRTRLFGSPAAISLISYAKIGALLGGSEASTLFTRSAALARTVPVYTLEVVRDFERMDDVVESIWGWHTDPTAIVA